MPEEKVYSYKQLTAIKIIEGRVYIGVEWNGEWGEDQVTFEELVNVPANENLENLIWNHWNHEDRRIFTAKVKKQFKERAMDVDKIIKE